MNKQEELKYKIKVHEGAIALSTDTLVSLRAELAEAEKPKLGHGDFGVTTKERPCGGSFVAIRDSQRSRGLEPYFKDGLSDGSNYTKNNPDDYTILGNIFDLLKEWSEDLDEFEIQSKNCTKLIIKTFGEEGIQVDISHYTATLRTLSEAEEFWHKLGQLIATLKRKLQAKALKSMI